METTRLSDTDGYVKPKYTETDLLTKQEIRNLLEDYVKENINDIPNGSHIRYFIKKAKDKYMFRQGGFLYSKKGLPKYIVLVNNTKKTWSVQVKNAVFYRRKTYDEIKDEYEDEIDELEKENNKLKKTIKELKHNNNLLIRELKKYKKM